MLIVNADDLGRNESATDRILSCYQRRRISSASAMVFMEDSERAATLAIRSGLDVGLHLNLSERLTSPRVNSQLSEAHGRICRFLKWGRYSLLIYNPIRNRDFTFVCKVQFAEFERLYGRFPSHIDGHQHMHLASNILIQRLLPAGARVRRSFSFSAGQKAILNRWYRKAVDHCLARRHRLTDYFFGFSADLPQDRLERILALAEKSTVELMTHPERSEEYESLMSPTFGAHLGRVRVAGFDAV